MKPGDLVLVRHIDSMTFCYPLTEEYVEAFHISGALLAVESTGLIVSGAPPTSTGRYRCLVLCEGQISYVINNSHVLVGARQ